MSEIATILMKQRSGMTTAAAALTSGLIASGLRVCFIVPLTRDIKNVPEIIPHNLIASANEVRSMTRALPDVYVFDDALRCAEEFSRHGEGDLIETALQRLITHQNSRITRIFLFQYTA